MSTRITCHLLADEFALSRTFDTVPGLALTCERVAASGEKTVTPLIRFRFSDTDLSLLETALADDPTVNEFEVLTHGDGGTLCYVHWSSRVRLLIQMLTATDAIVLSGTAMDGRWTFSLLFPTRDALSQLDEFCTKHNLSLDVSCVETWDGDDLAPLGLTPDQHEALATAYEHGYFKVPREIVLDDVATEIGISHQALSERLRRGHDALIKRALYLTTTESDTESEESDESVIPPHSRLPATTID